MKTVVQLNVVLLSALVAFTTGCATIVKSDHQTIQIVGGLGDGTAKVNLPDGSHDIVNGSGTILVTRSKPDIPIEVTCNGKTQKGVIPTHFDPLLGVAGNIIFGGIIGFAIDVSGEKAYDIKSPFNISSLCEQRDVASEPDKLK